MPYKDSDKDGDCRQAFCCVIQMRYICVPINGNRALPVIIDKYLPAAAGLWLENLYAFILFSNC